MTSAQIESTYSYIINALISGRLKTAFDKTSLLVNELQWGSYTDQFNDVVQNYRYMLQYFIQGVDDPERKIIYTKLIAKLITLTAQIKEELMMRNASSFEFTQKRYFPHKLHFSTTHDLLDSLYYFHKQNKHENPEGTNRQQANFEKLLPDLFFIYWLNTRLQPADKEVFQLMMAPEYPGTTEQSLLISALTLNIWRMFDADKLLLLLDVCQHQNMQLKQRALVGLCFIMAKYNRLLPYFPIIRNRLMVLVDENNTVENLKNIFMLIIGTADTDRITKKMQEEILPEIMKMSPMIKDRLDAENLMNSEEWEEENPEWNEILEQSGISDKLQEMSELQLEGADVYMSTFSALKSFPFFNETAHWFLPFDPELSAVRELFSDHDKSVMSAFLGNNAICNSDKYSFCLSVLQMPLKQREMMTKSFKAEAEQLEEITKDESLLKPDLAARNSAKQYIQDVFRFFKVHPQRADFHNMFEYSLELHRTTFFELFVSNNNMKTHMAEFYFTKGFYLPAIELFESLIEEQDIPSAALYQKIGFAYQKNSQIKKALDAYLKADMIMPDDTWTIKKIALCYRLTGDYEKALTQYRHVDFLQPDKFNTRMQIANCLIAMESYKDALQVYLKLEQVYPENEILWRAISWCAFIAENLHQAAYYMDKILSLDPNPTDFLNAGHIAFCLKKRKDAVEYYKKCLFLQNNQLKSVIDQFDSDKEHLLQNGLGPDEIALMIDELAFVSTE